MAVVNDSERFLWFRRDCSSLSLPNEATWGAYYWNTAGLEVLTAVVMKRSVFWDTTPRSSTLKVNGRFGEAFPLNFVCRRISQARNQVESSWHVEPGWLSTDYKTLYPRRVCTSEYLFQVLVIGCNRKALSVQTVDRGRNCEVFQFSFQRTFHCKYYTVPTEYFQNMWSVNLFPDRPSENAVL
jgi:hypothetical protein